LNGVALALGMLWVLTLIGLTLALALDALNRSDLPRDDRVEEEG
jgi:hypothetical protein